jgi:sugar phosphate isomerase/epimerase
MKCSLFNIAWEKEQDEYIAELLQEYEFTGIELAPAKVWSNPIDVSLSEAAEYKKFWVKRGASISSLCSLFYPHHELNLFQGTQIQKKMLAYFKHICDLAYWLGAEKMVFGSPQSRTYPVKIRDKVDDIAIDFFSKMAQLAGQRDLVLCIEPIPLQYGTNFINSTNEAIKLIEDVNSPFLRLHLDSGAMTVNQENIELAFSKALPFLEHFHISEDFLAEIGSGTVDHQLFARLLQKHNYSKWQVIEMRPDSQSDNIGQIKRSLQYVKKVYINEKI